MQIFLTGGSGFLGRAVIARLARLPATRRIHILLRAESQTAAEARLQDLLTRTFAPEEIAGVAGRCSAVAGDLSRPRLGLAEEARAALVAGVDRILHIGASTDFGAPLEESRRDNVEGTRAVLELAGEMRRQGVLRRFDYVSTAYVAGDTPGRVSEDVLVRGQTFANNYERSKYEAEQLVRSWGLAPTTIYRPSIVVGDSRHGFTPHFKVLYWPLRLMAKELLPFIPVGVGARLDVVPVDFVADAIAALAVDPTAAGGTYHLTAGQGREVSIRQVLRDARDFAAIPGRPHLPFGLFKFLKDTPLRSLVREEIWDAMEIASPYTSYVRGGGPVFDAARTHVRLGLYGIRPPVWSQYREPVLRFCIESRWGRRLRKPEYAYYREVCA